MRISLYLVAGALVFGFASQADAQSLHTAPRGTKVTGSFEIGGAQFPLPNGDWVLAGRGEVTGTTSTGIARIASAYLIEVVNGKIVRGVWANAALRGQGSGTGWSRDKNICDRTNTLFNVSDRNFNPRDASCWSVNHFTLSSPANPSDPLKDLFAYLDEQRLLLPKMRVVTEHWLSNTAVFLRANYFFDPEHVGVDGGPFERWDSADWNKTRISSFPDKRAFADKVEIFGREIHKQLELGLARRLDIGKPINIQVSGWPAPVALQAPVDSGVQFPARSPAERLGALESLKSRGLISDLEYQQQRQRILGEM